MSDQPRFASSEPIFWTMARPGYNAGDRERTYVKDGRVITERHPQLAHQGDYENPTRVRGPRRFIYAVRHDGATAPIVLTCAAAHVDIDDGFGRYQREKMRALGWYDVGKCPITLLRSGELQPGHFVDQSLVGADVRPCDPHTSHFNEDHPCPHAIAEKKAREDLNRERFERHRRNFKDPLEKQIEATAKNNDKMIDALREQNANSMKMIEELLAKLGDKPKGRKPESE